MKITRADGKHVHYDLIIEWAKDPTKIVQFMGPYSENWVDSPLNQPNWASNLSYRFKPEVITITHRKALMKQTSRYYINYVLPQYQYVVQKSDWFVKWLEPETTVTVEI